MNAGSVPVDAAASTPIPFDLVLASVGDGFFDTTLHHFVATTGGPYHFDYAVTLTDTGAGAVANGQAVVYAEVGSLYSPQSVERSSIVASFSDQGDTRTLSGSAIVELLAGQTLTLTAVNASGNMSTSIMGPTDASTPPFPTLVSGYSLF